MQTQIELEKRRIGSLEVTVIGIGCNNFGWRIDESATKLVVEEALDAGINFFDTADIYDKGHSEQFLGRALGSRRNDVVIASKFGMKFADGKEGASAAYIAQAAEDSLHRLGTDHIDLYQLHQPDPKTPIAETMLALNKLVQQGKVREIGCSNFSAEQIVEARTAAGSNVHFVSVQNQYSLFHRDPEKDVLPLCERDGLAFLPYFPLANGLLTGKYRKGQPIPQGSRGDAGFGPKVFTEANIEKVEQLIRFAEEHGHRLLDLAFSWLLAKPAVSSVIAGATKVEQVRQNARAAGWKMSQADLAEIDRIMQGE